MSGTYATPLRLEPVSTPYIAYGLLGAYSCAGLLAALLPCPLVCRLALEAGLLLSLGWNWRHHVLRRSARCIKTLTWKKGRECHVLLVNGEEQHVTLGRSAFVQPWLVILNFQDAGRWRQYLLLLPAMLDTDTFRRLRVRLHMELR